MPKKMVGHYTALGWCEECYEETLHRPETFLSQMDLVGMWCPENGWRPPPHLAARQGRLFPA